MSENYSIQQKDSLTPREIEVLRLIAAGQSDKAVADELGSVTTP
jgi:DNA-binding CsgD family transcriptional regulator